MLASSWWPRLLLHLFSVVFQVAFQVVFQVVASVIASLQHYISEGVKDPNKRVVLLVLRTLGWVRPDNTATARGARERWRIITKIARTEVQLGGGSTVLDQCWISAGSVPNHAPGFSFPIPAG